MDWRYRGFGMGMVALALLLGAGEAEAQLGRLRERAAQAAERQIDRALGIEEETPAATPADAPAASSNGAPAAAAVPAKPGEGAWANYDFVPGERILFADDFGADRVGNFPQRLEFRSGNAEVVEWQGSRYVKATAFGTFLVALSEVLPERFTVEFDIASPSGWDQSVYFEPTGTERTHVSIMPGRSGVDGGGTRSLSEPARDVLNRVVPVRIQVDGNYIKVYVEEKRVANAPNANLGRSDRIRFDLKASETAPVLIGNIRVGAGGLTLYDAIVAEGRVATQGILFDTGSDVIKPESGPTLAEIGEMLRSHPDLRLGIEGHTDSVGQAASNQSLSERRAAAVRQYLAREFGVDEGRLEAQGFGPSNPVASNDTPEGRQQNRRVELVKL